MGSNTRKKERQRLKRREKQRMRRRAQGGSPYRRIGASGEPIACYINDNWRANGEAAIYVLRRAPGGGHAMGAYLVDLWCAGLKDAWGRLDITFEEFNEGILERAGKDVEVTRVDLDLVRQLVAGGLRFAKKNGFRLPPRYKRWTALLGDLGDWESADLGYFGTQDGRLRYVGTTEDLRKRLIGCSAEDFLHRQDVEFILGGDDPSLMDDDEVVVESTAEEIRDRGLKLVRRWCFANGEQPHARLPDAWDVTFEAITQTAGLAEDDEPTEQTFNAAGRNLDRFLSLERPDVEEQLQQALDQMHRWVQQFDSPDDMIEALGLEPIEDTD